jgi:hypothetical protein
MTKDGYDIQSLALAGLAVSIALRSTESFMVVLKILPN